MTGLPKPGGTTTRRRRDGFTIRAHRSNCPACGYGIYEGDPTAWSRRPVTGTVHQHCLKTTEESA